MDYVDWANVALVLVNLSIICFNVCLLIESNQRMKKAKEDFQREMGNMKRGAHLRLVPPAAHVNRREV